MYMRTMKNILFGKMEVRGGVMEKILIGLVQGMVMVKIFVPYLGFMWIKMMIGTQPT